MKKFVFFLILGLFHYHLFSQQLITMNFGGQTRKYLQYVPHPYNPQNPVPVVFCLHGLGDNINNFQNIGMHHIGDTAGFITIYPEALNSIAGTAWNSGASYMGFILNSNVDDVGFLLAIIDSLRNHFNINTQKIYFCGFSMGGFMSQRMACEKANMVAAIASVAGTIGASLNCNPSRNVPIAHFHGTNDSQVSYSSNQYGLNAEATVQFWVQNNQCDTHYEFYTYPNIISDSITIESYYYNSEQHKADVAFFKAIGADHQWLYYPANDIDYAIEIWNFFRKFYLTYENIENIEINPTFAYPNPASNQLYFKNLAKLKYPIIIEIETLTGIKIKKETWKSEKKFLEINNLKSGFYIIKIYSKDKIYKQKIEVQ
ncbi:MAG: T9SS type A sorting domain-containing protein [Bacteroidales bacterium]|nr:T9SS type A sorting domain-containing protein [Bacteroidales bacterium]